MISFFDTISLDQINGAKLLNRVDTKYLVSPSVLVKVLSENIIGYSVVSVNNNFSLAYNTVYFDTPRLTMYYEHHNGKKHRYKVRYRHYEETGDKFIEVKQKFKNRTIKERLKVDNFTYPISHGFESLVHDCTPYNAGELIPMLKTRFNRITLVNKEVNERITIDLDINFLGPDNKTSQLNNCVIVEVKRDKEDVYSSFARTLKKNGVLPISVSKYILGIVSLNKNVKHNRFKPRLRKVNYLMSKETPRTAVLV